MITLYRFFCPQEKKTIFISFAHIFFNICTARKVSEAEAKYRLFVQIVMAVLIRLPVTKTEEVEIK